MKGKPELIIHPIGRVVQGRPVGARDDPWQKQEAVIEIAPAWTEALHRIEGFSHIWVLWWLDRYDEPPKRRRVRPERREEMPLVGILATRSPRRPNPIAMTAVRLLEHKGSRLRVQGLDAFEGTPVLDIKPYLRRGDLIPEATMPDWLEQMWRIHDQEQRAKRGA
jgi:tRNA-Thr(GGU) m(6)t(6)A37 methyltransferase TsaA